MTLLFYTLITGGTGGIGEEFARQYAAKQHNLILVARTEEKLQKLAIELKSTYHVHVEMIASDLSQLNAAEEIFEQCQKQGWQINFLINNAGVGLVGRFDGFKLDEIQNMLNLNMMTLTKLTYLFLPQLRKHQGCLINLASQAAFSPAPYLAAYAATKAYILSFTEALRVENDKENVRIMALCPGPTYTEFFTKSDISPDDIRFKFRPVKDVVTAAIQGIEKNKTIVIVGWENKLLIFLLRFFPRSFLAKSAAFMIKDGDKKP